MLSAAVSLLSELTGAVEIDALSGVECGPSETSGASAADPLATAELPPVTALQSVNEQSLAKSLHSTHELEICLEGLSHCKQSN